MQLEGELRGAVVHGGTPWKLAVRGGAALVSASRFSVAPVTDAFTLTVSPASSLTIKQVEPPAPRMFVSSLLAYWFR